MFYRNLEDKNIESNAEDEGSACDAAEGNLKILPGLFAIVS